MTTDHNLFVPRAKKSLGQNFLLNENVTDRISNCVHVMPDLSVIEVGPGPGGLTRSLLKLKIERLIAIEKDDRFAQDLEQTLKDPRFEIVHADALKIDSSTLCDSPRSIVSNLPYNISTVLLIKWLEKAQDYHQLVLMFQKEVAQRIVARPNTHAYGRLSVMVQWLCDVKIMFDLPPHLFKPAPKVTSSIVVFTPKVEPFPIEWHYMESITRAAFNQRRKMLRSSLSSLGGAVLCEAAHITPTLRAEDLTLAEFCALAQALKGQA